MMKSQIQQQSSGAGLPYPEIVCPCCSGRLIFESYRPAEVVPSCYTLKCTQCKKKEEFFYDEPITEEN